MLIRTLFYKGGCYIVWMLVLESAARSASGKNDRQAPGDECAKGTLKCHPDAECIDSVRVSRCRCNKGFYGDGHKCTDKNECQYKNGGCVHFCNNTRGNYTCSCRNGFQLDIGKKDCIDINECFNDKGGCQHQCVNTIGSYECHCNQGFTLQPDGKQCKFGNYCQRRQGCEHSCGTTDQGSVVCTCRDGYILHSNGKTCIQTCRVDNGGCQHNCTEIQDGVQCSCAVDYLLTSDKKSCIATCMVNKGGCSKKCRDSETGPVCSCPPGFQLHQDMKTCLDIDECSVDNGGCSNDCVNFEGGYECVCPPGYTVKKDQKTCEDIDECEVKTTCDHICTNSPGTYVCTCRPGYQRYGVSHCSDEDECSNNNGGCEHSCVNSVGSFTCTCKQGYKLHKNGKDCIPVNTCQELSTPPSGVLSCKVEGGDTLCIHQCENNARFTIDTDHTVMTTHCGPGTQYLWEHEAKNVSLPPCSAQTAAPNLAKSIVFKFTSKICRKKTSVRTTMAQNITDILNSQKKYKCTSRCGVDGPVSLKCEKNRHQQGQPITYSISAEFNLTYKASDKLKKNCDVRCEVSKTEKRLKRVVKKLRKSVRKNDFIFSYSGSTYTADKRRFKSPRGTITSCNNHWMLLGDHCVGCSKGSYYNSKKKMCELCPPGFYQEEESQDVCNPCTQIPPNVGIYGATNKSDCTILCEPGEYSETGQKPCKPCPQGTYQPEYGRTSCQKCLAGLSTKSPKATNFKECLSTVHCEAGQFYDVNRSACTSCARGFYQPKEDQDFCIRCPAETTTDSEAATDIAQCKSRKCGEIFKKNVLKGIIQSPNYPGQYPTNVTCVWKIRPPKDRRILVIIPEVDMPKSDKCGDKLVMRKSKNEYSTVTYETCESDTRPIAFTARSKRLWIQFQSDGANTGNGFSIPFVTYNADYQRLIESIVQDGRLYSSFQHQSVLKDRKVLHVLMDIVSMPPHYYKYANMTDTSMPPSFVKLITRKVFRFFQT